jgi:hypothetical protein
MAIFLKNITLGLLRKISDSPRSMIAFFSQALRATLDLNIVPSPIPSFDT